MVIPDFCRKQKLGRSSLGSRTLCTNFSLLGEGSGSCASERKSCRLFIAKRSATVFGAIDKITEHIRIPSFNAVLLNEVCPGCVVSRADATSVSCGSFRRKPALDNFWIGLRASGRISTFAYLGVNILSNEDCWRRAYAIMLTHEGSPTAF